MEALILTCSTGGGHNAAANAVAEALSLRGHTANILDPYSLFGERLANAVGGTYVRMVQISPKLFGIVYKIGDTGSTAISRTIRPTSCFVRTSSPPRCSHT